MNPVLADWRSITVTIPTTHTRLNWALGVLAFAQLIFSLDINIVYVALPDIGSELGFSGHTQQWVISAYTVFAGGFLLFGGRAADLLGRRRMFVTALIVYAVSSLAGGLATTPLVIVIARAVQGLGGALLLPSTLALISTLFAEGPTRNRALAIWGGAGASGLTLGALLGGLLTQWFGWQAVFYVNVIFAVVAALAALVTIPRDSRETQARRRFDLPGALSVTVAATLLVFVLIQAPADGWSSPIIVAALIVSAVAAGAFVVIEARSPDPLLPLALLKNRTVASGVLTTFIYMGSFGALPYFLTVLLQDVHRMSALQTGLAFLVPSIAVATGTQIGERLTNRLSARRTLLIGFALGIPGTAVLAVGFNSSLSYPALLPGLVISGLGQGIVWTAMWIVAATGVPHHQQGVANGLASTALNIGNAVGLAVLVAAATANTPTTAADVAHGGQVAVYLAATIMIAGLIITIAIKHPTHHHSDHDPEPSTTATPHTPYTPSEQKASS